MNKVIVKITAFFSICGYLDFSLASALILIITAFPSNKYIANPILPKNPSTLNSLISDYEVIP